ncbi:PREDICTED: uncharacterized protein LOC108579502 [Habropoda laboriosa]|uniref:uncharacterized protein LOC108579502 n=1 Tax=Habropoda laboriosa TaxID=597456 RepID=UPI00083DB94F|nr:PREDICTED: uncharacterized protein LOC108579502 [Habropoda laboriosa]
MDRKSILGRASLSFPAIDGLLDMDQLLEANPWNQINDFVQHNFLQNILDQFNQNVAVNPKLAPAGEQQKGTSFTCFHQSSVLSSTLTTDGKRTTRKGETSRTNGGAAAEGGRRKPKESEKQASRRSESGKTNVSEEKTKKVGKLTANLPRNIARRKGEKKVANASRTRKNERVGAIKEAKCDAGKKGEEKPKGKPEGEARRARANVSMIRKPAYVAPIMRGARSAPINSTGSKLPVLTSTPKRDSSRISNSSGKEGVIAKRFNGSCCSTSVAAEKSVKRKCDATTTTRIKEEKSVESNEATLTRLRSKKTEERTGNTERKRLIEKRERRKRRKIRRHEKKAERAMVEFNHHVMRIVKQMRYRPENGQIVSSNDFSDESSSSDSSSSFSSCSYCSACSC